MYYYIRPKEISECASAQETARKRKNKTTTTTARRKEKKLLEIKKDPRHEHEAERAPPGNLLTFGIQTEGIDVAVYYIYIPQGTNYPSHSITLESKTIPSHVV